MRGATVEDDHFRPLDQPQQREELVDTRGQLRGRRYGVDVPQVTVEGDDVLIFNPRTVGKVLMALSGRIVVLPTDESAAFRTAGPWPGITKHTNDAGRCAAKMRGHQRWNRNTPALGPRFQLPVDLIGAT